MCCCFRPIRKNVSTWPRRPSISPKRLQTPVFVLSDLDIGNERLDVPGSSVGRCLTVRTGARSCRPTKVANSRNSTAMWTATTMPSPIGRCRERTPRAPTSRAARGNNQYGAYTEDSRRIPGGSGSAEAQIRQCAEVPAQTRGARQGRRADAGIVSIGSCDGAIREALDVLRGRRSTSTICGRGEGVSVQQRRRILPEVAFDDFRGRTEPATRSSKSLLVLETAVEKSKLFSHPELQRIAHVGAAHRR